MSKIVKTSKRLEVVSGDASMVTKEETGEKDMFVLYTRYHDGY